MVINDIDVWSVEIPLKATFWPSWIPGYPQTHNRLTLLRLKTDEGVSGYSAGPAFAKEGKALKELLFLLFNRDPFNVEEIIRILRNATYLGFRLWFVEVALWDIIGKACGQPVYKLLGGQKNKVKAYCSTGEIREPKKRVEDVLKFKEMGFGAVKLRLHSMDYRKDLKVVEAVREAVGDSMDIMCDANQAWPVHGLGDTPVWDLKTAVTVAKELEKLNVLWLEEPLYKNDYNGLKELRSKVNLQIAGGEMNTDLHEFRDLIANRCYDILQPDATLSTGLWNARKVAGMCEANNLKFIPHTWTNGIGFAANLQLMGATPACEWCEFPYDPPGWTPEGRDALLKEPFLTEKHGFVRVPEKPGLGIEINEEIVQKYGDKA